MKKPGFFQISLIWSCLFCASSVSTAAGREAFGPANGAGLQGGLIVQLGASDTQSAARLSRTGRYLIHVLDPDAANPAEDDWPLYRHDRWQSGSATRAGPKSLGERWRIALDIDTNHVAEPVGPILHDWRDNPVMKGPLSAPTIACGMACGARHQHRFAGEAPLRPLVVFRDDNVYSSLNGTTAIFRRDFDLDKGEKFDSKWITGWAAAGLARKNGKPYRTYRIAEKARWAVDPFADPNKKKEEPKYGTQLHNRIHAMALAKDRLYVIHQDGRLEAMSTADGSVIDSTHVPTPAWDGLAIAEGRVFLTTQTGELVCLGE